MSDSKPDQKTQDGSTDQSDSNIFSEPDSDMVVDTPADSPDADAPASDLETSPTERDFPGQSVHEEIAPHHDEAEPLHDDEHEEHHPSISSRILKYIAVMAIGAGIVLWGGPKLAPNLPEWASPLARILTPGGDRALSEVQSLRSEVASQLDILPAPMTEDAVRAIVAETAVDPAIADRLAAVEETLEQFKPGEIAGRIGQMETRIEGLSAEVASLNSTLSEAVTNGGDMSAETLAQLAAKDAVIEGLKAEISELGTQLAAFSSRLDDVDAAARARAEAAKSAEEQAALLARQTNVQNALTDLGLAAAGGLNYEDELAAYHALNAGQAPEIVTANAASGVPSLPVLEEAFARASHQAIRASIKSEAGDGALSRVSAFFQSQVATRSLEPQEGNSTDAVLSRIGAALSARDLAKVLSEAENLSDAAHPHMAGWLTQVELRHSVLSAIDALAAQPS